MLDELANEILIASKIMGDKNLSHIAGEIGYRPMLLINAMYHAKETGKFVYNKKTDTISVSFDDIDAEGLQVTESMRDLSAMLETYVRNLNGEEKDPTIDEIGMLLGGIPELHVKIACLTNRNLATYELSEPKDKKSVYTFVTLTENLGKEWGKKQFDSSKSKVSKRAGKND